MCLKVVINVLVVQREERGERRRAETVIALSELEKHARVHVQAAATSRWCASLRKIEFYVEVVRIFPSDDDVTKSLCVEEYSTQSRLKNWSLFF